MQDEAKKFARSHGRFPKPRKRYFGFHARHSACKAARKRGEDWIVVEGELKFRGVYLLCELIKPT